VSLRGRLLILLLLLSRGRREGGRRMLRDGGGRESKLELVRGGRLCRVSLGGKSTPDLEGYCSSARTSASPALLSPPSLARLSAQAAPFAIC
jgi:hypothetical protein